MALKKKSLFFIFFVFQSFELKADMTEVVDPRISGILYHMLATFDKVCSDNDILYWVSGGTLLGAIRHSGIIPWDDDADVEIFERDLDKLLSFREHFEKFGYEFVLFYPNTQYKLKYFSPHIQETVWLDIFLVKEKEGHTYLTSYPNWYYYPSELFPLRTAMLGPIQVTIPHHPLPCLIRYYGENVLGAGYSEKHIINRDTLDGKYGKIDTDNFLPADYIFENGKNPTNSNQNQLSPQNIAQIKDSLDSYD